MKFIRNRIGTLTAAAILCLSTGLFAAICRVLQFQLN